LIGLNLLLLLHGLRPVSRLCRRWEEVSLFQPIGLLMEIGGMGSQCLNRLLVGDGLCQPEGSLGLPT
jgi:hypothetical protein